MKNVLLLRYSEIHLKGKNRWIFEKQLLENIKEQIHKFNANISKIAGRYLVEDYKEDDEQELIFLLTKVAGICSLSPCKKMKTNIDEIKECATDFAEEITGTFRVDTNRADKSFPYNSTQFSAEVGGLCLDVNPKLSVKLVDSDHRIWIDIREDGNTYMFKEIIKGIGGMPIGSAGKGLLMLSGGIDSPVAGYFASKRGVKLSALHFASPPYTNELARQKVLDLAKKLCVYNGKIRIYVANVTKLQEELHNHCSPEYGITLLRRCMYRIAEQVCTLNDLKMIITGESLGQVASQTIESITTIESAKETDIPVLRPLICFDKEETINIAKNIDTFDISTQPYQDCCTVFLPKDPVTKPKAFKAEIEEKRIDYISLIKEVMDNLEIIEVNV